MKQTEHDIVVIGGGPGGYVAAIRAAQLGMDVACIDDNPVFGGTCLRVGCIPSKALLESSHRFHEARHGLAAHGIQVDQVQLDLAAMLARKDKVVQQLTGGIAMLFKRKRVQGYHGRARLAEKNTVEVQGADEQLRIRARHIILATGSRPAPMRGISMDGSRIGDSTMALSFTEDPRHLVVIGGGYIGLELGSVWSRLGAKVTVLEALERILPGIDQELGQLAHRSFEKQGLELQTKRWVESATVDGDRCIVRCKDAEPIECDRVLLATGRVPCSDQLGLESVGIQPDDRGFVPVDHEYRTSSEGIYAIGDLIGNPMLAHKASEEGIVCVERIAGLKSHVNYDAIPSVVYTYPEIAAVGKTEEQLRGLRIEYKKGICPYGASGRAGAQEIPKAG